MVSDHPKALYKVASLAQFKKTFRIKLVKDTTFLF